MTPEAPHHTAAHDAPARPAADARPAPASPLRHPATNPERRPNGLWAERFDLIDAWRGLAALAVVVHHVAHIYIGGPAVMLFFVISGYCIAASADSCQRKGLGFGRFMQRRIRRIYPPYLLSVAFWAVTRATKMVLSRENSFAARPDGSTRTPLDWVQNLTLTQWFTLLTHPRPSAAANPVLFVAAYWSLCYEEQFYLLMGLMVLLAMRLGLSVRAMSVGLLGAGLVWNAAYPQVCFGPFIEYWALFCFGILVFHRLCRLPSPVHRRAVDAFLAAVLGASVYLRWFSGIHWAADAPGLEPLQRADLRVVYEELAIGAAFALLLIALRPVNHAVRARAWYKPLAGLGLITFSLYLIHQFNLTLVHSAINALLRPLGLLTPRDTSTEGSPLSLVLQIAGHIALATVFWRFCERPFLNKSLLEAHAKGEPTAPRAP